MTELFLASTFAAFFIVLVDQYINPLIQAVTLKKIPRILTGIVFSALGIWVIHFPDAKTNAVLVFGVIFLSTLLAALAQRLTVIPMAISREIGSRK